MAHFRRVRAFDLRVQDAALSRYKNKKGMYKRCGHQHRLKISALEKGLAGLRLAEHRLLKCRSFEQIHQQVSEVAGRVVGLGELWAYDTAVRIGMANNLAPKDIFLHAGTRQGAANLGFVVQGKRSLSLAEVFARYPELQGSSADDLESFFCVYKRHLTLFRRPAPRSCN